MSYLVILLITSFISSSLFFVDGILVSMLPTTLYAEQYMGTIFKNHNFQSVFNIFFGFGISLIVLKFIKKGFDTYILWVEGDADVDPLMMLTNFFRALAIAISFPTIYGWLAKIVEDLTDTVIEAINVDMSTDSFKGYITSYLASAGLFTAVVTLVWFIMFLILYMKFIKQGLELMILRMGVPLACGGLMDSDKGMFKPYSQKFFQSAATIVIQIALSKMGIGLLLAGHGLWGIAALSTALSTPRFLQEFMISTGGGGNALGNTYQTARLVQMASRAFK